MFLFLYILLFIFFRNTQCCVCCVEKQRIPSVFCQTIPDKQLLCSRVFAQMQRQGIVIFVKSTVMHDGGIHEICNEDTVTINPREYIAECIVFFVSTASRVALRFTVVPTHKDMSLRVIYKY